MIQAKKNENLHSVLPAFLFVQARRQRASSPLAQLLIVRLIRPR